VLSLVILQLNFELFQEQLSTDDENENACDNAMDENSTSKQQKKLSQLNDTT
jgi:hypothetical protein